MLENLAQKRLAHGVDIDQVNRPAGSFRQFGDQRQFLACRETAPGVYRDIQIAFRTPTTGRQRTEQNSQPDARLRADGSQDRSVEVQVFR